MKNFISFFHLLIFQCYLVKGQSFINPFLSVGFDSNTPGGYMQIVDPYNFQISPISFSLNQHSGRVNDLKLLNDTILASGSDDSSIKIWDYSIGHCIKTITTSASVKSFLLLPNDLLAVAMFNYNNIEILNWKTGIKTATSLNHGGPVNALEAINNGRFASGSNDQYIYIWSLTNFAMQANIYCNDDVLCLKYLPNGVLASAVSSNVIYLWNLSTNAKVATLSGHTSTILCLEVLPNLDLASSESKSNYIWIWDINTQNRKYYLAGHTNVVNVLKTLPNGFLASGSSDQRVKIWNATKNSLVGQVDTNKAVYSFELLDTSNITFSTTSTTTTTKTMPSVVKSLNQTSFSFPQLTTQQKMSLFDLGYDLSGCILNCSNNGRCNFDITLNAFYCVCDSIYSSGSACQLDTRPCSSNPCLNNASCFDYSNFLYNNSSMMTNTTFNCLCDKYHEGLYCESKIDICKNETCSGNGICQDLNNKPTCKCFSLYLGEKCDQQSSELRAVKTIVRFTSIIAIIAIFLFYLIILTMDITKYCFKRDKKKKNTKIKKYVYINFKDNSHK